MSYLLFNNYTDGPFYLLYKFMDSDTIKNCFILNKYCNKYLEKYIVNSVDHDLIKLYVKKRSRYDLFKIINDNIENQLKNCCNSVLEGYYNTNRILCVSLLQNTVLSKQFLEYYFTHKLFTMFVDNELLHKYVDYLVEINDV